MHFNLGFTGLLQKHRQEKRCRRFEISERRTSMQEWQCRRFKKRRDKESSLEKIAVDTCENGPNESQKPGDSEIAGS